MDKRGVLPIKYVIAAVVALLSAAAGPAAAQDEELLKSFFEGRRVTVKLDMPGTSDGIDLHIDSSRSLDSQQYRDRLKAYGTALRAGESATVTVVKVKRDLIEFQLAGGGFGTFGDDTSTTVYMPLVERSNRERELEKAVKEEDNQRERRELERELDELRERRERENRRIEAARAEAEERKRELVAERRLNGGSRFNLRYSGKVPAAVTSEDVMAALAEYVDFRGSDSLPDRVVAPAPASDAALQAPGGGTLRKGMTRVEVERDLGVPSESSEHREGSLTVTTLVYFRQDQRIAVDFVDEVLVRYSLASR